MAQELPTLLDQSLDHAAMQHFSHLFSVLMAGESSDDASMQRFEKGLRNTIDVYYKTADLIEELKVEYGVAVPRR